MGPLKIKDRDAASRPDGNRAGKLYPNDLSAGEKQRGARARWPPSAHLIADEPTGTSIRGGRDGLRPLRDLRERHPVAVATHAEEWIRRIPARIRLEREFCGPIDGGAPEGVLRHGRSSLRRILETSFHALWITSVASMASILLTSYSSSWCSGASRATRPSRVARRVSVFLNEGL
jgi:hypothetical protein